MSKYFFSGRFLPVVPSLGHTAPAPQPFFRVVFLQPIPMLVIRICVYSIPSMSRRSFSKMVSSPAFSCFKLVITAQWSIYNALWWDTCKPGCTCMADALPMKGFSNFCRFCLLSKAWWCFALCNSQPEDFFLKCGIFCNIFFTTLQLECLIIAGSWIGHHGTA